MVLNFSKVLSKTTKKYLARFKLPFARLSAYQNKGRTRRVPKNQRDLRKDQPSMVKLMENSPSLRKSYLIMLLKQLRRTMTTLMMITPTMMARMINSKMTTIKVTLGDSLITKII